MEEQPTEQMNKSSQEEEYNHCHSLKRATKEYESENAYLYTGGEPDFPPDVTKIIVDSSVIEVDCRNEYNNSAFEELNCLKEVVFNEGIQRIGNYAFYKCYSLKSVTLPSTLREIGDGAFVYCYQLKEVILNEGLRSIGDSAFGECGLGKWLERIIFPSTLTEIKDYAFGGCAQLQEVELNNRLRKIGDHAFDYCEKLEWIKFPATFNRVKSLSEADRTPLEVKLGSIEGFQWRGNEAFVSLQPNESNDWIAHHWPATRGIMDEVLAWINYHEIREGTTMFELALWKAKIEESGAVTSFERDACRIDVPGPVKESILQLLHDGTAQFTLHEESEDEDDFFDEDEE